MVELHWRRWIVENLVRRVPPADLVSKLVAEGISPADAENAVISLDSDAWLELVGRETNRVKKRDWLLRTLLDLRAGNGHGYRVDARHGLDHGEFFDRWYAENRPVVLRGLFDGWPALSRWTVPYLRARLGDREVEVQSGRDSDARYERRSNEFKKRLAFSTFADHVERGAGNDHYMTANNGSANADTLRPLLDDYGQLPSILDAGAANRAGLFWLGPAGTVTPLHHDLTNNLLVQFMGRKRVRLAPSIALPDVKNDLHVYAAIDPTDPTTTAGHPRPPPFLDVLLVPGDALFLPIGWWHHVTSIDASISITFTNFVERNDFHLTHDVVGSL